MSKSFVWDTCFKSIKSVFVLYPTKLLDFSNFY